MSLTDRPSVGLEVGDGGQPVMSYELLSFGPGHAAMILWYYD